MSVPCFLCVVCVRVFCERMRERESEKRTIEMFKRKGLLARDRFPLLCSSILPPSSLPPSLLPSLPPSPSPIQSAFFETCDESKER
jgi:hypothetical protein